MRNSATLPSVALVVALVAGLAAALAEPGSRDPFALSELQIGLVAWAFALAIFGLQGLLSVAVEGRELRPGRQPPHLTDPLSVAIVVFALLLVIAAGLLGYGIIAGWSPMTLGLAAGIGCIILALLLVSYKEGFVGEEASFDRRDDGIPW